MKKQCNVCFGPIPEGRLKVLPSTTTCVTCSTESKWSGVHVIHHKTGNEVEVIKNPQTAAEFHKLSTRAGFGTTRGLKPGFSKGQRNAITIAHSKNGFASTTNVAAGASMDFYPMAWNVQRTDGVTISSTASSDIEVIWYEIND